MNKSVFEKTLENARKRRDIKLVTKEVRRVCLVSEPNYHTAIVFSKNLLAIEMKRTQILMNKPVYSGLSILEMIRAVIYGYWYFYVKPK